MAVTKSGSRSKPRQPKAKRKEPKKPRRTLATALAALTDPVDSPGEWRPLADILAERGSRQLKSFGFFFCDKCRRGWHSAHAFSDARQACQKCETWSYPAAMWINFLKAQGDSKGLIGSTPHDAARCEACRMGRCVQRDPELLFQTFAALSLLSHDQHDSDIDTDSDFDSH